MAARQRDDVRGAVYQCGGGGGAGDRAWGREEGHKPKKLTYIGSPFVFGIAGKKPKLEASSSCERPSVTLKPTWAFQG